MVVGWSFCVNHEFVDDKDDVLFIWPSAWHIIGVQ